MSALGALWRRLPEPLRQRLRALRVWHHVGRWVRIWRAAPVSQPPVRVFYGHDHIPSPGEPTFGGIVKFQRMQEVFPNDARGFNVLYMVSSRMPEDWRQLVWLARARRARVVWNQNGVAYPAWYGAGWEGVNRPLARMVRTADYVFFQSHFCKLSADRFLGERQHAWEVLHNAVDTTLFTPAEPSSTHELILLAAGTMQAHYRMESSLRTLHVLRQRGVRVKLIIAGKCHWSSDARRDLEETRVLIRRLGVEDAVEVRNGYAQSEAPQLYRSAHVLLHTQYNDASPGVVVEALACGLPVVYSASGGVPELVGDDAGIGIPAPLDWEQLHPPEPAALADAVLQVIEQRARYAEAARQRAVERFDVRPWLRRHGEVFETLLR